jgi:hypothetical protein
MTMQSSHPKGRLILLPRFLAAAATTRVNPGYLRRFVLSCFRGGPPQFVIRHSSFVISVVAALLHSSFVIRHSSFSSYA